MFSREEKAVFPFILLGLFDPEGLGAAAGRIKSESALISPDTQSRGGSTPAPRSRAPGVEIHYF
ncbi:hypothetical protein ACQCVP_00160 [Rossellomorea vietnamensis]|uniref:hypothetical protein n=1 Tax=Rossellomorea vietnamensis TaxID=218284 RepID=UPI003CFA7804